MDQTQDGRRKANIMKEEITKEESVIQEVLGNFMCLKTP
jgi:hypothetical protein